MSGTVHDDGSIHTYEVSPAESFSQAVVAAVSAVSGDDRTPDGDASEIESALDPLYSVVDPDALDALFRDDSAAPRPRARVEFCYEGYRVAVRSDGLVALEPERAGVDAGAPDAAQVDGEPGDAVEEASD